MPRFSTAFTPPPVIEGLTVTATGAGVVLDWEPSTLAAVDFVAYQVYRDGQLIARITDQALTHYVDRAAPLGRELIYRVTQQSLDLESLPAEASTLIDACEFWLVGSGPGSPAFELPNVTGWEGAWPKQQMEHEPLGRPRKLLETGELLGEEGTLELLLTADDAARLADLLAVSAASPTGLLLKDPYGSVTEVVLGSIVRQRKPGNQQAISFRFVEVGAYAPNL